MQKSQSPNPSSAGVLPVCSEASAVSTAFRQCTHVMLQAQTLKEEKYDSVQQNTKRRPLEIILR